jgi:hypothetical protein
MERLELTVCLCIGANYYIYQITYNLLIMNEKGASTLSICKQKLSYLNYSKNTQDSYLSHISKFLKTQNKSCLHLNSKDFNIEEL